MSNTGANNGVHMGLVLNLDSAMSTYLFIPSLQEIQDHSDRWPPPPRHSFGWSVPAAHDTVSCKCRC